MTSLSIIARVHSDFPAKFGIPRQSSLVAALRASVVFEPEYRNYESVRGLEEFSHIWLIWEFSQARRQEYSPTVRPPRLGGNTRVGVFASRSPYRPNSLGLSCVKLHSIGKHPELGPVIHILGADIMHGTPVYDIKPYIPFADCHTDAHGGFADSAPLPVLAVELPDSLAQRLPPEKAHALRGVLAHDPRPPYHDDPARVYGMEFAGFEIKFRVQNNMLYVLDITNP